MNNANGKNSNIVPVVVLNMNKAKVKVNVKNMHMNKAKVNIKSYKSCKSCNGKYVGDGGHFEYWNVGMK